MVASVVPSNDGVRVVSDREWRALLGGDLVLQDLEPRWAREAAPRCAYCCVVTDADLLLTDDHGSLACVACDGANREAEAAVEAPHGCECCGVATGAQLHAVLGWICPECCSEAYSAAHEVGMADTEALLQLWADGRGE